MILDKENDLANDEAKDDDDENEDALCVLRRCCLELLSALAALTAACLRHRQGGREKKETHGGRCQIISNLYQMDGPSVKAWGLKTLVVYILMVCCAMCAISLNLRLCVLCLTSITRQDAC